MGAIFFDALDDVVALLPKAVHFDDFLGWMLEIAVDDDGTIAEGVGKAGEHGGFFAEVAGKVNAANMGIAGGSGEDVRPGIVGGAVVDKEKLVGDMGVV